jgi:hypothetical protein
MLFVFFLSMIIFIVVLCFLIEANGGGGGSTSTSTGTTTTTTAATMTTSHMYLVITTAIWMNKTSSKPRAKSTDSAQNVPFGVFGIMLPYKTVRSTHFSNLCVRI